MAVTGKLSQRQVETLRVGKHGDGGGLWLRVRKDGSRAWVFRYMRRGRSYEMGLGATHTVLLDDARAQAREARCRVKEGKDPIALRREEQLGPVPTFSQAADRYITTHELSWRNPKHRKQWRSTLKTYANPHIGESFVDEIDLRAVIQILEPIWSEKRETASRVRGRIEKVLDWARVQGYRSGDNPARWRGNLDTVLPGRSKDQVKHFRALSWKDVPAFLVELSKREGVSAKALEFTILTAARSGETRFATWDEIDFDSETWTVPASRMKANQEHRVPLSDQAVVLLESIPRRGDSPYVFRSPITGGELSDMAMTKLMRNMDVDAVPHGFRSSFRDWAAESTSYANHVAEMALAHSIGDKVEAAYRRGDLLAKRKRLMQDWADYCHQGETQRSAKIVGIGSK